MRGIQMELQAAMLRGNGGMGTIGPGLPEAPEQGDGPREGREALTVFNEISARISLTLAKGLSCMLLKGTT